MPGDLVRWVYGVRETSKRGLQPFSMRLRPNSEVGDVIEQHEIFAPDNSMVASELAEGIYLQYVRGQREPPVKNPETILLPQVGSFCWHNDSQGHHAALILSIGQDNACALFLTSKGRWNPHSRPATEDEATLWLGRPFHKQGYLAPVRRLHREFFMPRPTLMKLNDVVAYLQEFAAGF
jgi:hypothetical protein